MINYITERLVLSVFMHIFNVAVWLHSVAEARQFLSRSIVEYINVFV